VNIRRLHSNEIGRRWMALLLPVVLLLLACSTVPITGRSSLQLVPQSQLLTLSFQQYDEVLQKSSLSQDPEKVAQVRRVGFRIADAAEAFLRERGYEATLENYNWEFNLIEDDDTANAWVMPGGKAAVYTGILKYTQNETGLAVVLGHEVAHAIADHGNERMSQQLLAQMGGMALAVALSSEPQETRALALSAFGVGTAVGVLMPYSRLHESEADHIGLILMARAGYDPREAVPFWQRMNEAPGQRPPELLSTHPAPETRMKNIRSHIPEAMQYYRRKTG